MTFPGIGEASPPAVKAPLEPDRQRVGPDRRFCRHYASLEKSEPLQNAEMPHSFRNAAEFGLRPLSGTGTLPVGVQGRSALPAGGNRREAKLLHGKIENFAA